MWKNKHSIHDQKHLIKSDKNQRLRFLAYTENACRLIKLEKCTRFTKNIKT